jgi:hypothetical protein
MIQSSQSGDLFSGSDNWRLVKDDLAENPPKPTIDGEAMYENLAGWDAFGCRRRAYWSVFAGAFGHTYGCNGVWGSYRGGDDDTWGSPEYWRDALDQPGASDMKFLRRLIESRPMLHRVPAQSMLLSDEGEVPDHIQVTRDSSGRFAFIYVPVPDRQFKVDMSRISGSKARAWWFNPRNGNATSITTYNTSGSRTFTTPDEGTDWILVLDDDSQHFSKPGTGGPLS